MKKKSESITWTQLDGSIRTLATIGVVIATFAVGQFRIGNLEKNQESANKKLGDLSDYVLVIGTKLGIPKPGQQSNTLNEPKTSYLLQPSFSPNQNLSFSGQLTSTPEPTPVPTPIPTLIPNPEPTGSLPIPTPIKNLLEDVPILERIPNL